MSIKTVKMLTMLATVLLVISIGASTVFALTPTEIEIVEPTSTDIQDLGGKIIGILQTIGVVLAVVIMAVLGIKYMMGSAEEKAEYKKTMIPYLVGAIFIFAASTLANMVYNFVIGI